MSTQQDVDAIKVLYANIETACSNGDAVLLAAAFTEDRPYMPPGDLIMIGREAIEERYTQTFKERTADTSREPREIVVDGDLAYGRYN